MSSAQDISGELRFWKSADRKWVLGFYPILVDLLRLHELADAASCVADLGCGGYGGIFNAIRFRKMYAIDPLWEHFEKMGMLAPEGVMTVTGDSTHFDLPESVDLLVSTNALDHSGDLAAAGREISRHLRTEGRFALLVHLRAKNQINRLHPIAVTIDGLAEAFGDLERLWFKTMPKCPLTGKPYHTYYGVWKKAKEAPCHDTII